MVPDGHDRPTCIKGHSGTHAHTSKEEKGVSKRGGSK